jgi:caspase domain-containing protein
MSLYWPLTEGEIVTTTPRLHALIIGVGEYDHLGLGVPKPATFLSGLALLTTTPLSARRVARWLESDYRNDDCPVGSIELLLSPAETVQRTNGSQAPIDKATMANITTSFKDWFMRCNSGQGNIAFLYFAGHGISTIRQFLLPADFGNPDLPDDWENCIDFTGLQVGMAKCKAKTQLFFVDACRDAPVAALVQQNPHGKPLVTSSFQDKVDLSAAYFASSEGRKAFGRDGEETFFCKALIMCLEGVAARKAGPQWRIDAASLSSALVSVVEALAANEDLPLTCACFVQKPAPLHFPAGGSVVVMVDCTPEQASAESSISVEQGATVLTSPAGERRPWLGRVNAGSAKIEVTFASFLPEIKEDQMAPPTYELEVQR